ncbi:MAG: DUF4105 domain-containing protein [Thermoguttaceae bacterium]|jgi:hypothetical protein
MPILHIFKSRLLAQPGQRRLLLGWIGLLVLLAIGCKIDTQQKLQTAAAMSTNAAHRCPTADDGPMFPTLTLNPDLFKWWKPSNDREWTPGMEVMPKADFRGERITVRNVRSCRYRTYDDFDVYYHDKTFDLNKLTTVDLIVVPFNDMPGIAHTMLSFGFDDQDYVAVSVEIRREKGEKFNVLKGFFRQYELMYVVADEQDVITKNANKSPSEVYLYRSTATPEQARELFADVMKRVDKLIDEPEFYNTLTNNCTTNIRNHINHLKPDRVPYDYRVLLPGYADRLAYDLGLIEQNGTFEQTKEHARINYQAYLYRDDPDFSRKIRR